MGGLGAILSRRDDGSFGLFKDKFPGKWEIRVEKKIESTLRDLNCVFMRIYSKFVRSYEVPQYLSIQHCPCVHFWKFTAI